MQRDQQTLQRSQARPCSGGQLPPGQPGGQLPSGQLPSGQPGGRVPPGRASGGYSSVPGYTATLSRSPGHRGGSKHGWMPWVIGGAVVVVIGGIIAWVLVAGGG
jgi:hypothetical protein